MPLLLLLEAPLNPPKKPPASQPIDAPKPKIRRASAVARKRRKITRESNKEPEAPPAWVVTPHDLDCLDDVRTLLSALNDAYVSSTEIQNLVQKIPVLSARCIRRIGKAQFGDRAVLERALTEIGNMGVENELLGLLEDLTTCQADLRDQKASDEAQTS